MWLQGARGATPIPIVSKWFAATILVLALRLISLSINTKKTCKDAEKSLTACQADVIDALTGSILAVYIRCRPGSHRSNNTKSFLSWRWRMCQREKQQTGEEAVCLCVTLTCQQWTECPVSWSSAESQGDAGTRSQRACLWTRGTSGKLRTHNPKLTHLLCHLNQLYTKQYKCVQNSIFSTVRPMCHCCVPVP